MSQVANWNFSTWDFHCKLGYYWNAMGFHNWASQNKSKRAAFCAISKMNDAASDRNSQCSRSQDLPSRPSGIHFWSNTCNSLYLHEIDRQTHSGHFFWENWSETFHRCEDFYMSFQHDCNTFIHIATNRASRLLTRPVAKLSEVSWWSL